MFRSHVISWNLTKKCNLRCEHCYISAGRITKGEAQGELSTEECLRVVDQICEVNSEALLILTGGEPLLRKDVFEIAGYANEKGLWVVVGTNGVLVSEDLCRRMIEAGIRGVALSLDSLDPATHDLFRGVQGAWENTVSGSKVLNEAGLPFIIQTTIGQHNRESILDIARFAYELGARVYNLYFLVPTGRGAFTSDITPEAYEETLGRLREMQEEFAGKMLVNSKCAPHYQRVLYDHDPDSPFLKSFSGGAGGCPAGTHYLGIRPNGDMTPCPYLPVYGGNLREQTFREIWEGSSLFNEIRQRDSLGGRCGSCEFDRVCGGCRARAFGATGSYMAEDPWCVYEPGAHGFERISFEGKTTYGLETSGGLPWTPEAEERLAAVPSFVRGMLVKRVEAYAREKGHSLVTAEVMQEVRERVMSGRVGSVPSFLREMLSRRDIDSEH
jgi:radical SAM protein with 4Fe4S-binding SPASM domain